MKKKNAWSPSKKYYVRFKHMTTNNSDIYEVALNLVHRILSLVNKYLAEL